MGILTKFGNLVGSVSASVYNGFTGGMAPRRSVSNTTPPIPSPQGLAWARKSVEKVRQAFMGGGLRYLPNLDWRSGETPEIRAQYYQMWKESTVKAGAGSKIYSVCALEPQVHPEDPDDPLQQWVADFLAFALRQMKGGTWALAWEVLAHGLTEGHVAAEKVWRPEPLRTGKWKGKRVWRCVKAKEYLQPMGDEFGNVTSFRAGAYNSGQEYPASDFVVWQHMPFFQSAHGTSDLRAAYRAYFMKQALLEMRGLHLQQYTGPFMKGTYADDDKRASLEAAMEEAQGSKWVSIPTGTLIEIMKLSEGTGDFEKAIHDCDIEMHTGINFGYLQFSEGEKSDGTGDTSVHKDIGDLPQYALATALGEVVSSDMVPECVEINFGPRVPPPLVTWGTISESDMATRLKVDAGLKELGFKLSAKEAARYYGRTEATDPKDILGGSAPPADAPQGGQQPPDGKPPADPTAPGGKLSVKAGAKALTFSADVDESWTIFSGE